MTATDTRLRVLVILDGWPSRATRDAINNGELPEITDWLAASRSTMVDALAPIASLSYPAHASLLTGSPVARHQIPTHLWLDHHTGRIVNLQATSPKAANRWLSPAVRTLFERDSASSAIGGLITRGAHRVQRPITKDPARLVGDLVTSIRRSHLRGLHVCWLPGVDATGHRHGPDSEAFRDAMHSTSRALRPLFEIASHSPECCVVLASDHGLRASGALIDPVEARAIAQVSPSTRVLINPLRPRVHDLQQPLLLTTGGSLLQVYYPERTPHTSVLDTARASMHTGKVGLAVITTTSEQTVMHPEGEYRLPFQSLPPRVEQDYPDLQQRLIDWAVPRRTPQLALFTTPEHYFGTRARPGYNWGRHLGTHGGPSREESLGIAIGPFQDDTTQMPLHQVPHATGLIQMTQAAP